MRIYSLTTIVVLAVTSFVSAETHTVWAVGNAFQPVTVVAAPGDTINWQNAVDFPHTVTSGDPCTADGLFNHVFSGNGDTFTWDVPLDASGDIPYFCQPHCGMGMAGVISINAGGAMLQVPGDYPTIAEAIDAAVARRHHQHRGGYVLRSRSRGRRRQHHAPRRSQPRWHTCRHD